RRICSRTRPRRSGCGTCWSPCGAPRLRAADRLFFVMKLVLFDIDGTLLWTDGAGRRAIQRALLDEAGTAGPIERYRFDGKTDPQIVRDLLSLAGHPAAEGATRIDAVRRRSAARRRAEQAAPAQVDRILPGTPAPP